MLRFPFSVIVHGFPMGLRFAFTMRTIHPRELIDEITHVAEMVRKSGPMALENVQVSDRSWRRASLHRRRLRPGIHPRHDGA